MQSREESMSAINLNEIFTKHGVQLVYLFGSRTGDGAAYQRGEDVVEEGSDLDVGVVFARLPEKLFAVYGELYAELSMAFPPFAVDLVFLQETDALFQYEAIRGVNVFCKNEVLRDEYEEMVMKLASDLSFKKAAFDKDCLEAVRDGYFEIADRKG